jgi:glycosyltransferase involved in cell wall biosynthesis
VLDDGSTDNSIEVLQSYPEGIFHWESHTNVGQSATLNKGWSMAKGDVLSYLSADDVLLSSAVTCSVENLRIHENIVMTYGDYMLIDDKSEDIRRIYAPEYDYEKMLSDIVVQPGPGIFFRRSAFAKIGGWNSSYRQVPDLEYWLRLGLQGDFLRIPEVLAKFRIHDESQTYAESSVEKAEECIQVIDEYFKNSELPDSIRSLENRSKGNAHLFVARMHLRAGRYQAMFNHLKGVAYANPRSLLSMNAVRMIGNGLLFRLKRISHMSVQGNYL